MSTEYRKITLEPIDANTQNYATGTSTTVSFSWTSSDLEEWLPMYSYMMMELEMVDTSGNALPSKDASDNTVGDGLVYRDWPQRIANRWTHLIAGSQVAQADKPLSAHLALKISETSYAHEQIISRQAFGSLVSPFNSAFTTIGVAVRPPMYLYYKDKGVRGARHELKMAIPSATDIKQRVFINPANQTAKVTSLRLFVAKAQPQVESPLDGVITMYPPNVSIYNSNPVGTGSVHTQTITIPETTYHLMVWLANTTDETEEPDAGALKSLSVRFRGVTKPTLPYDSVFDDDTNSSQRIRAFADSMSEAKNLGPNQSYVYPFNEWVNYPVYHFATPKRTNLPDRELQVRFSHDESGETMKLVICAFHSSRLEMVTENSRVTRAQFIPDSA